MKIEHVGKLVPLGANIPEIPKEEKEHLVSNGSSSISILLMPFLCRTQYSVFTQYRDSGRAAWVGGLQLLRSCQFLGPCLSHNLYFSNREAPAEQALWYRE